MTPARRSAWLAAALAVALGCGPAGNADAGSPDAGRDPGPLDSGLSDSLLYCNCLLIECHEDFHDAFGATDMEALAACEGDADAVPRAGAPTTSGDNLECRRSFCEGAADDPGACAAALGGDPCR